MLTLSIFKNKPFFKKSEDELVVDLTKGCIKYNVIPRVSNVIFVTAEFVMRPDLLAQSVYGDASYLDMILKYNGISNPFSLYEGQGLYIPDLNSMQDSLIQPKSEEELNRKAGKKTKPENPIKKTSRELRQAILEAKTKPEIIGPNIATSEDIQFENGKIVFGTNVGGSNKDNCTDNLSRARLKEKLLNSKIFR